MTRVLTLANYFSGRDDIPKTPKNARFNQLIKISIQGELGI